MEETKTIIKTVVTINNPRNFVPSFYEFYTKTEPSKQFIKEKIEKDINISLKVKNCSPDEGGDFGAFFFYHELYVTYSFKEIELIDIKN